MFRLVAMLYKVNTQIQLDRMVVRIIRGGAVSILYGHIHGPRPILATTS